MVTELGRAVRFLIRTVLAMPENSVRPEGQNGPAGGQVQEIATVNIANADDVGYAASSIEDDGHGGSLAVTQVPKRCRVSVNFFRSPSKDVVGIAKFAPDNAFDRASTLAQILQRPSSIELMQRLGLGLLHWSDARNLRALADATWESRAQIDLFFNIINRDAEPVAAVATVPTSLTLQPVGTITKEITP